MEQTPVVTMVIPHWQVKEFATLCLRSIRKYTRNVPYEVIVVDNGSKDESLDYLRSLPWIRLVERGEATPTDWVLAMATALDYGIHEGRGKYLLILHTDVFFKKEGWLRRLIDAMESDPKHAAAGTGKLEKRGSVALFLKELFDTKRFRLWLRRTFLRDKDAVMVQRVNAPRDFCALYKLDVLRENGLSFVQKGKLSAGESIFVDLKRLGHTAAMIPVPEMMEYMDHVAHGTAGLKPQDRALRHSHTQRKSERRVADLFEQPYVKSLRADASLDG